MSDPNGLEEYGRVGDVPLPLRVVIGANGAYWRDFGSYYSMAVVSSDNDPVEEIASYVPEDRLRSLEEQFIVLERAARAVADASWSSLDDDPDDGQPNAIVKLRRVLDG